MRIDLHLVMFSFISHVHHMHHVQHQLAIEIRLECKRVCSDEDGHGGFFVFTNIFV